MSRGHTLVDRHERKVKYALLSQCTRYWQYEPENNLGQGFNLAIGYTMRLHIVFPSSRGRMILEMEQ